MTLKDIFSRGLFNEKSGGTNEVCLKWKRKSRLFGRRMIVENTFGDATGERAPRLARLVKLRREAKGDLGILFLDRLPFGVFGMRLDDDVWCHVAMVSCTQGIPDDKLRWRWLLQNQTLDFAFEQTTYPILPAHTKPQSKLPFSTFLFFAFSLYQKNEKSLTMIRIDIYLKPSITAVVGWIQPPLISKRS